MTDQQPSVFFPEKMDYVEIVSPLQAAYYCIKEIAESGNIQLIDSNTGNDSINKRYTEVYLQCEEAQRSLDYMKNQLVQLKKLPEAPKLKDELSSQPQVALQDLIQEIRDADSQLREKTQIFDRLHEQLKQQIEKQELLLYFVPLLDADNLEESTESDFLSPHKTENMEMQAFNTLPSCTGYVANESLKRLQNIILRVSRRNAVTHFGNSVGDVTPYVVFTTSTAIHTKINQICLSFSKAVYQFPSAQADIDALKEELASEIQQTRLVCQQAYDANAQFLNEIAGNYWRWTSQIAREAQIWSTIDFGDFQRVESSVVYRGWMPRRFSGNLAAMMERATTASGSPVAIAPSLTHAEDMIDAHPPTYIQTNHFSYGFQMLNDAYGIPDYTELNAGAFYGMYPFLFAIMFGDMGHSLFYLFAAIGAFVFVRHGQKTGNSYGGMVETLHKFKWLLLIASVCSFYCGFLYNECFGVPIDFFGTHWKPMAAVGNKITYEKKDKAIYPFGMDPQWLFKDNELIFLNSFKMKLSIVMGMTQMIFGLILSLINHIKNKNWVEFWTHWIPEILYLVPFFGYLVVLIIKKWLTVFKDNEFFTPDIQENGVNLIQVMIGMILSFGSEDDNLHLYEGQFTIQMVITIIFFVSIPLFLFGHPIVEIIMHRGDQNFSILEAFVMNLIHVIEFCLSALSHTASYLRLWALSLAHSQLSHVLWDELFLLEINMGGITGAIVTTLAFMGFACFTAAILLGMEAFSALLHAIRLMWVEFCSKFYNGQGYKFHPVSLKKALKKAGLY